MKTQINVEKNNDNYPQLSKLFTVKITKRSGLRSSLFPCICSIITTILSIGETRIMKDISPIQASWFYTIAEEKVKLNWFLFEYACEVYDKIKRSDNEALCKWRSRHSNKQRAEFCAYFAKRMRRCVLDRIAEITDELEIDDEYILDYCHKISIRETSALMDAAVDAWVELLDICAVCPCRCLSERHEYCDMFDGE